MAEIGLLPFARVALHCAAAILPPYRSRFSKHQFTQPQLLAVLCLMRYEDWTFREAEVRLAEHGDLREVLKLDSVPDYTTLYRFLRRLDDTAIDRVLGETVRRFKTKKPRRCARVAVDGTGLAHNAASTFFIRRIEQRPRGMTRWSYWLKYLIVGDLDRQIILAQRGRQAPWCDCRSLPGLVDAARRVTPIGLVLADAEFDTEQNHQHIRQQLGARSIIPAKRGRSSRVGIRGQMRRHFPRRIYCQRAKVETIFSIIKRKLSARAPGRTLSMQTRQALLLGLSYNLYRLRHRHLFMRMSTEPFEISNTAKACWVVCFEVGARRGKLKTKRELVGWAPFFRGQARG
jgi:IS5 family transposase